MARSFSCLCMDNNKNVRGTSIMQIVNTKAQLFKTNDVVS